MAKVKIRMLHSSNHPDGPGEPGDIIECDAALAQRYIDGKGAELIAEEPAAPAAEQKPPAPRRKASER